ncbi:hypothetical protein [Lederbergia citri]|uniref:Uncharacterized protein n=1 Tax=Lederbergia citri TaxID=2833580 RepID=A0A942TEJ5_9BACI|nr:hypothetical protein [Lederbergia citri]MBS4195331.1 hypothetical protein [Lederbergia citri]
MNINVKAFGVEEVARMFEKKGVEAVAVADKVTETYTRKMANDAAANAPVKDNILAPALAASPEKLEDGLWQFGNNGVEYTRRQEYEHPTKKGFIRKSVWNNREPYREALRREVTKK